MSAATTSLIVPTRKGNIRNFPVKAATKVWQGTFLAVSTGNVARPGVAANSTDKIVGLAIEPVDNSLGADGDLTVNAELGIFEAFYTGTAPTVADVGAKAPLYVSDDNTVTLSNAGTPPQVGTLYALSIESGKCWVKITA